HVPRIDVVVMQAAVVGKGRGDKIMAEQRVAHLAESQDATDRLRVVKGNEEVRVEPVRLAYHDTPGEEVRHGSRARRHPGVPPRAVRVFVQSLDAHAGLEIVTSGRSEEGPFLDFPS